MKVRTLLVAAVMFVALSAAAFAQATFTVGSTPVTAVIDTGLTEKTGDISFSVLSVQGAGSIAGTISINYNNIPITNPSPIGATVTITTTGAASATVNELASDVTTGLLVIDVPAGLVVGNVIRVSGVRVAVANSGLTSLDATISSVGNLITAGQTGVRVISAIKPGIVVSGEGTEINAVNAANGTAMIDVKEGFLNAFGLAGVDDPTTVPAGVGALGLRITLNQAPPHGMTITMPASIPVAGSPAVFTSVDATLAAAPISFNNTSTDLEAYYLLSSSSLPTLLETLEIPVTVTAAGHTYVGATPITATVTLFPVGTVACPTTGVCYIPRYAVQESSAITLVTYKGATTSLLIPYGQVVTSGGYDTGIAIANTTTDPGETVTPQPGTITFNFYPNDPAVAPFAYTTAAGGPGSGLDATGKVPSGSTYVVLLSELLTAARATVPAVPTDFAGYIFIQTNFTHAHGLFVLSNFTTFSQGGLILVVDRDGSSPENLNN